MHSRASLPVAAALATLAGLCASCANHGSPIVSSTPESIAVSNAIPAIDAGANAANAQSGAISLSSFLIPKAEASVSCGEYAVDDTCTSGATGVKKADYVSCSNWGGTLTGTVTLTYSDTSCAIGTSTGQTLTRNASLTRTWALGGTVISDSVNSSKAYDGTVIGAGTILTYTNPNYTLAISGVHKTGTLASGGTVFDESVRTSSPMTLTGALSGVRTVDGGSVTLYDNSTKFQAVFVPHDLSYSSSSCCHPVASSLDVSFSGTLTGSGVVTFTGACGQAQLTFENQIETVALQGCE